MAPSNTQIPDGADGTTVDGGQSIARGALQLVVVGAGETLGVLDLPPLGSLTIGRGGEAEVSVADRSVSRRHARLHVLGGPTFAIEDLGSANGTVVGDARLDPGQHAPLAIGELISLGSAIAFIQRAQRSPPRRDPVVAAGFEAALANLARDAAQAPGGFRLLILEVLDGFVADRLLELAAAQLPFDAVFSEWGHCRYALLLPDERSAAFISALSALKPALLWGEARFPADGDDPATLMAAASSRLEQAALAAEPGDEPLFCHPHMARLYELARRAATGTLSVLLVGETGVGKDVVARAVHRHSPRAKHVFGRIECAALTEALAESELFGHERGAFTGAAGSKTGLLEAADGGTVFLDEVGELSPRLQAKLLHVIETRQTTRVGAVKGRALDVRFVAATNRDLQEDVARGAFRKDLYYRLAGISLRIPPLRDRPCEVVPLARTFLRQVCRQLGRTRVPDLSPRAVAHLEGHRWPGNVRELRNLMERATLVCDNDRLLPADVMFDGDEWDRERPRAQEAVEPEPLEPEPVMGGHALAERRRIEDALSACAGNQTQAAKLLGVSRGTLVARIGAFKLARPRKPANG
jgi:two-component system response regulator AtoC